MVGSWISDFRTPLYSHLFLNKRHLPGIRLRSWIFRQLRYKTLLVFNLLREFRAMGISFRSSLAHIHRIVWHSYVRLRMGILFLSLRNCCKHRLIDFNRTCLEKWRKQYPILHDCISMGNDFFNSPCQQNVIHISAFPLRLFLQRQKRINPQQKATL